METYGLPEWAGDERFLKIADARFLEPADSPEEVEARLHVPFRDVKSRAGGRGHELHYITSRQCQRRLDEVFGPFGWEDRYYDVGDVLFCELSVTLPGGRVARRADAGGYKEMTTNEWQGEGANKKRVQVTDEENTDKTGASDAIKRAAVKFGVGRYLYKDGGVPERVIQRWLLWGREHKARQVQGEGGGEDGESDRSATVDSASAAVAENKNHEAILPEFHPLPSSGRSLARWAAAHETRTGVSLQRRLRSTRSGTPGPWARSAARSRR